MTESNPYDHTVEVTNRIQGIKSGRVPEELWREVCNIVAEVITKSIPKKMQEGKVVV